MTYLQGNVIFLEREGVEFKCEICGKMHPVLWLIRRKLYSTFGHFPVYLINKQQRVYDPTLPFNLGGDELPRDAVRVPDHVAAKIWHSEGHMFNDGVVEYIKLIKRK